MRNITDTLLPYCVRDSQFDGLAFEFDDSDFEVHSNGGDLALCVCVVSELKEKA